MKHSKSSMVMPNSKQLKILLLFNEKIITRTLDEFLSRLGCQVTTLQRLDEIVKDLRIASLDKILVICGENSFRGPEQTILRILCEQHPHVHFIVITENAPEFSTSEAISLGIYGYLHKPISLAELELLLVRLNEKNQE